MSLFAKHVVSASDAAAGLADGATLLDVRTKDEWRQEHVTGARHIVLDALPQRVRQVGPGPVYVICRSGNRSGAATRFLRAQGVDAYNVRGGMIAWRRAGLPVAQKGRR